VIEVLYDHLSCYLILKKNIKYISKYKLNSPKPSPPKFSNNSLTKRL